MKKFVRTAVATEGYQEITKVGGNYICHLEGEEQEGGLTSCWECIETEEPNIEALKVELAEYKSARNAATLSNAIKAKQKEINKFDSSSAVNAFTIKQNGAKVLDYWINRDLRTSLEGDVVTASATSETYKFDVRELGVSFNLNCTKFLQALAELRTYAYTAYNVTSQHLAAVQALTTVEEVEAYDYTVGYPEKLEFDLADLV